MRFTRLRDRAFFVSLCAVVCAAYLTSNRAVAATNVYLDVNGTATGSGVTAGGNYSWESNFWNTTSTGITTAPGAYVDDEFPRFAAGTDAGALNYTVTANANHRVAGMFLNTNGGGTVT